MKKIFALIVGLLLLGGCANSNINTTKQTETTATATTTTNQNTNNGGNVVDNEFYIIDTRKWAGITSYKSQKINFDGDTYTIDTHNSSEGYYSDEKLVFTCDKSNNEITLFDRFYNEKGSKMDYFDTHGKVIDEAGWRDFDKYVFKFTTDWEKVVYFEHYELCYSTNSLLLTEKETAEYDLDKRIISFDRYNTCSDQSLVLDGHSTSTYEYDSEFGCTETNFSYSLKNGEWIKQSKKIEKRNSNGRQLLYEGYNWSLESNKWIGSSKEVEDFDSNDRRILSESYSWYNKSNEWILTQKEVKSYNSQGSETLSETYSWSSSENKLIGNSKYIYGYNSEGNRILVEQYNWSTESSDWIKYFREVRAYSVYEDDQKSYNYESLYERYHWSTESNNWIGFEKYEYTMNNNSDTKIIYHWESESNDWVKYQKIVNEYTANISTKIAYNWSSESNDWIPSTKEVTEYDELYSNKTTYHWSTTDNDWVLD